MKLPPPLEPKRHTIFRWARSNPRGGSAWGSCQYCGCLVAYTWTSCELCGAPVR